MEEIRRPVLLVQAKQIPHQQKNGQRECDIRPNNGVLNLINCSLIMRLHLSTPSLKWSIGSVVVFIKILNVFHKALSPDWEFYWEFRSHSYFRWRGAAMVQYSVTIFHNDQRQLCCLWFPCFDVDTLNYHNTGKRRKEEGISKDTLCPVNLMQNISCEVLRSVKLGLNLKINIYFHTSGLLRLENEQKLVVCILLRKNFQIPIWWGLFFMVTKGTGKCYCFNTL